MAEPTASASAYARATFLVTAFGRDGRKHADIPVRYRGPVSGTAYTGSNGIARIVLPPAVYRIEIPAGCGSRVIVQHGQSGRLGLSPGSIVRVPFEIEATRRYVPSGPIRWSSEPPWTRGAPVTFRFSLADTCHDRLARRTSYADARFSTGGAIALDSRGTDTSDDEAYATLKIRCTRAGDGHLWFIAPDGIERTDLLSIRGPTFGGPWCR